MKRTTVLVMAFAMAVGAVSAGIALATPGSGTVTVEYGRKTVPKFHSGMSSQGDVVVDEVSYSPGGYSGWHSHPGKVVVAVQRGAFTLYKGSDPTCTGTTYQAGEVFFEYPGTVYYGRNESATISTVLDATFFSVPQGGSIRIDQPSPGNCPF